MNSVIIFVAIPLSWLISSRWRPWTSFEMETFAIIFYLMFAVFFYFKISNKSSFIRIRDFGCIGILLGSVIFSILSDRAIHDRTLVGILYVLLYVSAWLTGLTFRSNLIETQTLSHSTNSVALAPTPGLTPLMTVLVMVCLISAAMGLIQWAGLSQEAMLLGIPITEAPVGARVMANLGQPNLLALVLSFAMFAAVWLMEQRQISKPTAWVLVLILAITIGLTQSRAIFLGLVCATLYLLFKNDLKGAKPLVLVGSGIAIGIGSSMATINALFFDDAGARQLLDSSSASARLHVWQLFLQSIASDPWSAEGVAGTLNRYLEVIATTGLGTTVFFSYAHNLVIDLMLWFGAPLGFLLTVVFAIMFWQSSLNARGSDSLLMCIPLVFAVHSMLELPYAYFSISVIPLFILGYLQPSNSQGRAIAIQGWQMMIPVLFTAALAIVIAWDYQKIYRGHLAVQLEKRFETPPDLDELEPRLLVLTTWGNIFKFTRLPPEESCKFLNSLDYPEHLPLLHPSEYLVQKYVNCLSSLDKKEDRFDWRGIENLYKKIRNNSHTD